MKKEFRIVDEKKGLVQVTTTDERFYGKIVNDKVTGLPVFTWKPSITFITSTYPKGSEYVKWVANRGYDEAERIKIEAGDRGTIVHHAIEKLINEKILKMDDKIKDAEGVEREMTPDEYYCVMTFEQWYKSVGCPKALAVERTVESELYQYAGTLDYLFEFLEGNLLLDIKISRYIYPDKKLQTIALKQACKEENIQVDKMGILQVGYMANKNQHYKFNEVEDNLPLFLSTKEIWANEYNSSKPLQRDFPLMLELNNKVEKVEVNKVNKTNDKINHKNIAKKVGKNQIRR